MTHRGSRGPHALLAATAVLALAGTAEHPVEPGDTLSGIAAQHDISPAELARANDIADRDAIIAGTTLRIPASASDDASTQGEPASAPTPAHRGDVGALIARTSVEYGWSPAFVKALAWQESGWQQGHVSRAGAVGIMQVLPSTGRFVSTHLAGRDLDLDDPTDNVRAGVLFLDYLHDLTGGDVERTLAGYYQGLASLDRHGEFDDTRAYIDNVLALRERFR